MELSLCISKYILFNRIYMFYKMSNIIINDHGASHLSIVIIQLPHNNIFNPYSGKYKNYL